MSHKSKTPEERSTPNPAPVAADAADAEALRQEIQLRAYHRYCERGCEPGGDVDDWVTAEREVLAEREKQAPSAKGDRS